MAISEINLEDVKFEYDFSAGQGFECFPDMACGLCCKQQFNVTYREINQIVGFLKEWLLSAQSLRNLFKTI